ncbi:uncharacterized protein [Henckelia pumila]|uniref:uncharacterized protein n=1 Tax=Henckelia pumila TaxID=405737 RepID=UPI003C6E9847
MRVCMEEKPALSIYSLRNKSWTTSDWYHGQVHHHSGVLVNGALHFKVQGRYKREKCGVVALSLATDQCSRFALPPGQHEAVPPFGFVREHGRIRLVGSCNGLVCLVASSLKESIVLWNPASRKHRAIDVSPKNYEFFTSFGFGYDPSSDDYKVMRVCMEEKPTLAKYSLRNKSWTTSDWYHGQVHHHSGVLVNGALHFKVQGRYKREKCGVVALSLATDQCSRFALPVPLDEKLDLDWAMLGVLGGCLCLYIDYGRYSKNVWVMKEYGVSESWTKVATFFRHNDDDAKYDNIRGAHVRGGDWSVNEVHAPSRSKTSFRPPIRYTLFHGEGHDEHIHGYDPRNFTETISDGDSPKWLEALSSEMDSMYSNQVWSLIEPHEGIVHIGCKWIYKRKLEADGKTMLVNGDIKEEIYMFQPKGFTSVRSEHNV